MISRLPQIPIAELNRIKAGTGAWRFRTLVRRPGEGAWTDLTNEWVLGYQVPPSTPDAPAETFTITFLARAEGQTLALGMASDPLNRDALGVFAPRLYPGTYVEVWAANDTAAGADDGTLRLWLEGRVGPAAWPEDEVSCTVYTPDSILNQVHIEEEGVERGALYPGTPLATEIQENLTAWAPWAPPLTTIGDPQVGVGPYLTEFEPLGPQLRQWAQEKGWDFRHLPLGTDGRMIPTLYLPPRDKTVPDLDFATNQILGVPELAVDDSQVRAHIYVKYPDPTTGELVTVQRVSTYAETQFIPRAMQIKLASDDPAANAVSANRLADYAVHDVGDAFTTKQIETYFNPWLTLHDMIGVDPDDVRFDYVTRWAVLGVGHTVTAEKQRSQVDLRGGSPVGQYYSWFARETPVEDEGALYEYGLIGVREMIPSADGLRRWGWTRRGRQVKRVVFAALPKTGAFDEDAAWTEAEAAAVAIPETQEYVEFTAPVGQETVLLYLEPQILVGGAYELFSDALAHRILVKPLPANMAVSLTGTIVAAAVDLTITTQAAKGATVYPAVARVFEAGTTKIAEFTITADGTFTKTEQSALGGRLLPMLGVRTWVLEVTDAAGNLYRDHVEMGALAMPAIVEVHSRQSPDLLSVDIYGTFRDPWGKGGTLMYWLPADLATPADPLAAPTGSLLIADGSDPGAENVFYFGPTTIPDFGNVKIAGNSAVIYFQFITTDGRDTGIIAATVSSSLQFLIDQFGQLRAGSVHNALVLSEMFRPYFMGNGAPTLTVADYETNLYFDVDTLTPYRDDGAGWVVDTSVPAMAFAPILRAGVVTAEVIAAGAVRAKLVGAERLVAGNINIGRLDLIASDAGAIVDGSFVAVDSLTGQPIAALNLGATGSEYVLYAPGFRISADGSVTEFDGTGTFRGDLELEGGLNTVSWREAASGTIAAQIRGENVGKGLLLQAGTAEISLHDFGAGGSSIDLAASTVGVTGVLYNTDGANYLKFASGPPPASPDPNTLYYQS